MIEVALSVVLLVSAGLTVRTFAALQSTDPGINPDRVLIVMVPLPPAKYATLDQRNRFGQELLERVAALPGVDAATFGLPFGGPQIAILDRRSGSGGRFETAAAQPGGRGSPARVRDTASPWPHVRCR